MISRKKYSIICSSKWKYESYVLVNGYINHYISNYKEGCQEDYSIVLSNK